MKIEIESSDIFQTAYLLCGAGGALKSSRMGEKDQVVFTIEGDDLQRADMLYHTGKGCVEPLQMRSTLNYLRDLVFKQLRNK